MHFDLSKFFINQYKAQALLEDWQELDDSELDEIDTIIKLEI